MEYWDWDLESGLVEYDIVDWLDDVSTAEVWSSTPGVYSVQVCGDNDTGSPPSYDTGYVYVVDVTLSGGGSLGLGDLVEVDISLLPTELPYGVVYADVSGGITVWEDQQKTQEVTSSTSWSVYYDEVPSSVWVEGTSVSSTVNDAVLEISYYKSGTIDSDTAEFTVVEVEMTDPSGNPEQSSEASEGVNEFTFDSSNDGYCYVKCEAQLTPDNTGTQTWAESNVEWSISGGISGSELKWGDYSGGTFTEADNKGELVWIQFKDLPEDNDEFGKRTITMNAPGTQQTNDIEIFFSRDATNNPGGSSPNWFYYWNQAVGDPEAKYVGGPYAGAVPAMALWSPTMSYSKTEIGIGSLALGASGGKSGIDYFLDIIKHEKVHVTQISKADTLLGSLNGLSGSIWEKGWSFDDYSPNNHWTLGVDGKAGVGNVDDDDDDTDEVSDNSEVGFSGSDDIDLDADDDDIPDSYENENPAWFEDEADAAEDTVEDANKSSDWGDPGKQHVTNEKYDD